MKSCSKGASQPVLILYESVAYLKQHLEDKGGKTEKMYYENMKANNFWKDADSSCTMF